MEKIYATADKYKDEIIKIRRDLHKYPEVAWTEFRTTDKIIKFLKEKGIPFKFGLEVINPAYVWSYPDKEKLDFHRKRAVEEGADEKIIEETQGYTGVMAEIDSERPGPTLAFRFDMDCNEVEESKAENHRPNQEGFASTHPKCMHACGHDGHTAMGLVLAAVLNEHKEAFQGKVKILYQPSEEGDKGAQSMVEKGLLEDVDMVFGMHIYNAEGEYPGIAGSQMGLYATTKFDVHIKGKASHAGAAPEEGKNAILAAVQAISGMQCFYQDGRGATRLNIGTIEGGTGRNVIPEECFFRAETRGSTTEVEKNLYNHAVKSIESACSLFGCTYELKTMGYGPKGDGTPKLAAEIAELAQTVPGVQSTQAVLNNTGGTDDFTYMMEYLQKKGKPAAYMALLTKLAAGLHNGSYDFDEAALLPGVKTCLKLACHYGREGEK